MRPFVNHIYSNLKSPKDSGEPWDIEISQHTLLVGSNTSHKSSIIQSVELSVAGSADDIFGRSAVSDAALLLTLAPADELGISSTLSNGATASFNARREDGKTKRPTHLGPGADTLVHRDVTTALSGSPASARKAFLSWSGAKVTLDDVLSNLPDNLRNKYEDIAAHKGRGKTAVQTLLEVVTYAGQRQREAAKEAKGAEIILESIGDTVEARPTEEDMGNMKMAVAQAREILDVSIRASGSGVGMSGGEKAEALREANEKLSFFKNETTTSANILEELQTSLPSKGENVDYAIKIVDVAIRHSLEACPVCSSQVGSEHLKNCQSFYQQQQTQWEEQSAQKLGQITKLKADMETCERQVNHFTSEIRRLENVRVSTTDSRALPVSDAQSRLEAAMDALSKMEIANSQWENLANARERVFSMKAEVDTYKELKLACEVTVGRLLSEQAKDFSVRVQKYLPNHWDFNIELLDGVKEVFRMGIMRDGKLHAALSGAEWTSVVTAISMAVSERLPNDVPAILIPEDRAWDGKTLGSVMRGFSNFEGQVIMASTIRPTGRPPKGWTIIDMDQVSDSWCMVDATDEEESPVEEEPVSKTSINHASGGFRVTSRSSLILEETGFDTDMIQKMSRDTVASIIKDGLSPENVSVNDDGTYNIVRSAKVLPMPPAPNV
jgi:hypothetical protein